MKKKLVLMLTVGLAIVARRGVTAKRIVESVDGMVEKRS